MYYVWAVNMYEIESNSIDIKDFLVYASRAINVLITVIFRVFFDDDNELTHFFRGGKSQKCK